MTKNGEANGPSSASDEWGVKTPDSILDSYEEWLEERDDSAPEEAAYRAQASREDAYFDSDKFYNPKLGHAKPLKADVEWELFEKISRARESFVHPDEVEWARTRIIESNYGLCKKIALYHVKKMKQIGASTSVIEGDDLFVNAVEGLMHAMGKFDHNRGFRFSTYAYRIVERYVKNAINDTAVGDGHERSFGTGNANTTTINEIGQEREREDEYYLHNPTGCTISDFGASQIGAFDRESATEKTAEESEVLALIWRTVTELPHPLGLVFFVRSGLYHITSLREKAKSEFPNIEFRARYLKPKAAGSKEQSLTPWNDVATLTGYSAGKCQEIFENALDMIPPDTCEFFADR